MREFLRYLFVVAAMLMVVVGDAWAECYVINESQIRIAYSSNDANESGTYSGTYALDGPCYIMSFSYRLDANTDATYWHKFSIEGRKNGGEWTEIYNSGEIKNAGSKTVSKDMSAYANTIDEIRFKRTARKGWTAASAGTKDVLINNLKITRLVSMSATPNPLPFSLTAIGETSDAKQIFVDYSNIGVTQVISSTNTTDFTVTPRQNGFDNCSGTATYDVVFHPKGTTGGDRSTTVTIAGRESGFNSNKKYVTITVNGTAKGFPEHTWNGSIEYYVDESIDLSSLWWTSNSEKAPSYAIEKFVAEDETGVTPILNNDGISIKLTRAGKLTVKIIQDASKTYSALSTTQEITIKKYPSNFKWNLGDPLDCYVDDSCDESLLFSRLSDAPMTIASSNTNAVVYSDGKFTAVGAGEAVITVKQDKHYKWTDFTSTYTIRVNKYDMSASLVKGDAVLNELISSAIKVSHGLQDYNVESKNPGIAEYLDGNKIQTYYTEGTAQFRVTRDEDRRYKKLDVTLGLNVEKSGEGCILFNTANNAEYKVGYYENKDGFDFSLGGVGSILSIDLKKQGSATDGGYIYVTCYNTSGEEVKRFSVKNTEISTDWGTYTYDISQYSVTKVNVRSSGDIYHDALNKYFRNIKVTRKKELDHQVAGGTLVLPQTNISKSSQKSFDLKWSTCADEILLVSNNDLFEVGVPRIDASAGGGTTPNIVVTFKGSNQSGKHSAIITIYDQTQVKELHVTCEVKAKLATEIVYTGETHYADADKCYEGLFSVKDENGDVVSGAEIVLESSNPAILEVCGNTGFDPHCGGVVTLTARYAGDELREGTTWSKQITVVNCIQTIVWDQDFRNFIAAEDGSINETRALTAKADPTGFTITYELDDAAKKFARIENGKLVVFGVGTGHIIASAPEGSFEEKKYGAASVMHEIRVRKRDDKCETYALNIQTEEVIRTVWASAIIKEIGELPESRMEFYAHTDDGSLNDKLTVKFSVDGGSSWGNEQKYNIENKYDWTTPFVANVPEGATHVSFKTQSSLNTYFNCVTIRQKTYLRANVDEISIQDAIVNEPFSTTFVVEYSDVPYIQYSVTDSHDLGLKLEPNPTISNDCGDWGTYTFTLTGESPYPQSDVKENIRLYTSAGDKVVIPITITATLSEPFYFNVQDGDWNESTNWTYQNTTDHGMLPDKRFPIVVSKAMTINEGELVAYGVTIENGGSVNIQPKGGLTLHAGGFTNVTENNFEVQNNKEGVGYVRVSPYFINKVPGTMPNITIQYTTRAKAGGAKDQVWQYVGAPGNNMQMSNDGVMVYWWSEIDGWVYSNTNMTPFEGYALTRTAEGTGTYSIVAQPIHADQTITLTKTDNGGMNGDNLFVNSYLAPIDLTKFTDIDDALNDPNDDFRGDFKKTFYLFNSGSWNDWQGKNGEGANKILEGESAGQYYAITPLSAALIDPQKDQTTLPPMQGVYVVANGEAQIHLKYNKHVFTSASCDMNRPMRAPQIKDENFMRVRMQVNSQNSGADRMYVIQYANTTRNYDNGYDAKNIIAQGQANIYTNELDGQMEISVADQIDSTFIGFAAGEDSVYILTFTSLVGQDMYLHDIEADSLFLLVEDEQYTFKARPNSVNDMRFQLLLYPDLFDGKPGSGVTTGVDNLVSSAHVWVSDKRVYITDAPQNSNLVVYTANGMCITSPLTIHHTPCTIDLSHLPTGVYVLRLNNQAYKFVCK